MAVQFDQLPVRTPTINDLFPFVDVELDESCVCTYGTLLNSVGVDLTTGKFTVPNSAPSFFTPGTILGFECNVATLSPLGTKVGAGFGLTQSVATSGIAVGAYSYVNVAHPSGTVVQGIAHAVQIVAANGGTSTTITGVQVDASVTTAAVVTTMRMYNAVVPSIVTGGSIGTLYGLNIPNFAGIATTNIGIEVAQAMRVDWNNAAGETRLMIWDNTAAALRRVTVVAGVLHVV